MESKKQQRQTKTLKFVIPNANNYTNEDNYMSDCLSVTTKEYPRRTALAICISNWRNRTRA